MNNIAVSGVGSYVMICYFIYTINGTNGNTQNASKMQTGIKPAYQCCHLSKFTFQNYALILNWGGGNTVYYLLTVIELKAKPLCWVHSWQHK